ncbi:SAM-dependent methyltransferase [Bacteroidota bacterium]|nr:SAM-dependent methyltransferase [Bacteroidota bacterium]
MSLEHHGKPEIMFQQQLDNARQYVVPFIQQVKSEIKNLKVLEVGAGEGGVLCAVAELGADCVGLELAEWRVERGKGYAKDFIGQYKLNLRVGNFYDEQIQKEFTSQFDVIILKDVIEHLPEQEKVMKILKQFLKKDGIIFFGFPPWCMPFGGHQQIAIGKLGKMPYYHILPRSIYNFVLKNIFRQSSGTITALLEVHDTKISINRFERCVKAAGMKIIKRELFLINPIYKYKFGLMPRKQIPFLKSIPFIRDFFTTCCYYIVR